MTPYLDRPLRPRHVVIAELLANMSDTFILVDVTRGEPYLLETDLGQSLAKVVSDLATGMYDFRDLKTGLISTPVAVLRISRDAPVETVTGKVAAAVLAYLETNNSLYDEQGFLIRCPFLDTVWPEWERQVRPGRVEREYEHEEFLEKPRFPLRRFAE